MWLSIRGSSGCWFFLKKTDSFFWVGLSICGGLFLSLVAVGVLFYGCLALI
jgi:hypothetical protein